MRQMILFLVIALTLLASLVATADPDTRERCITLEAPRLNIDPDLARSIVEVESNGNEKLIGKIGELSEWQLRPNFHMVRQGDTYHNCLVALRYLNSLYRARRATYGTAFFVAYNFGPSRTLTNPKQTAYFRKVMAAYTARKLARRIAHAY